MKLWRCRGCGYERAFDDDVTAVECPRHPTSKHFHMHRVAGVSVDSQGTLWDDPELVPAVDEIDTRGVL